MAKRVFDVCVKVRIVVSADDPKQAARIASERCMSINGMSRVAVTESFEPSSGYTYGPNGRKEE